MTEVTGILPTTLTVGLRRTQTKQNKKAATTKAWKRDLFFPPLRLTVSLGCWRHQPSFAHVWRWWVGRVRCAFVQISSVKTSSSAVSRLSSSSSIVVGWMVRRGGVFLGGWHPVGDPWRPINCWHPTVPCGSLYLILILLTLLLLLTLLPALLPTVPCGQIR